MALIDGVKLKPVAIRKYNEWILGLPGTEASLSWSYGCPEGYVKEKPLKDTLLGTYFWLYSNFLSGHSQEDQKMPQLKKTRIVQKKQMLPFIRLSVFTLQLCPPTVDSLDKGDVLLS